MDKTKRDLIKFVNRHKGELCLDYYDVVRLMGFHEDKDDYYYDVLKVGAEPNGRIYSSCIGLMLPFKGKIPARDYKIIDTVFQANWNLHHDFMQFEKTRQQDILRATPKQKPGKKHM